MNKAKTFTQLSEQERSQIEVLLKAGKTKAEIARLTEEESERTNIISGAAFSKECLSKKNQK